MPPAPRKVGIPGNIRSQSCVDACEWEKNEAPEAADKPAPAMATICLEDPRVAWNAGMAFVGAAMRG